VLADIQLEDGLSFSIFEQLQWKRPVIFITAYDAYAIRAFKANGIDYLLKPCDADELRLALERFRSVSLNGSFSALQDTLRMLQQQGTTAASYKERFAVTMGSRIVSIDVNDIAYFYFANRMTQIVRNDGQKFPYAESLDFIGNLLNPVHFFRVNRNYIIHHKAIDKIESHMGRNITLTLQPAPAEGALSVSKDRITEFKYWLDQ
jgi:DNA-binding LytR/AlgR family response regulator